MKKVIIIVGVVVLVFILSLVGFNKTVMDKTISLGIVGINPGSANYVKLSMPSKITINIESEEPIIFYLTDPDWCQMKTRESQDKADRYYVYENGIVKDRIVVDVDTTNPCMLIHGPEEGVKVKINIKEKINLLSLFK